MSSKKRITLSIVSIAALLALLVGVTMAWFTDVERVDANFEAGVLDITVGSNETLDFENLRPMASEEAFLAEINSGIDYEEAGFEMPTVYVQDFAITNAGTMPVKLQLTINDGVIPEGDMIPNIVENGFGGVMVGDPEEIACDNLLKDAIHLVLLEKSAEGVYTKVASFESVSDLDAYLLVDENGEALILNAGVTSNTYAIGAYLDVEAGNEYQGKHYHAEFVVGASQTDEGATFGE